MRPILPAMTEPDHDYEVALRELLKDGDQRKMLAAMYDGAPGVRAAIVTLAFASRLNGWSSQRVTAEVEECSVALVAVRDELRQLAEANASGKDIGASFKPKKPPARAPNADEKQPKSHAKSKSKGKGGTAKAKVRRP